MTKTVAKVTTKGQLTVPLAVRKKLGVKPGDVLEFIEADGEFRIRKVMKSSPFDKYVGYLKPEEGDNSDEIVRNLRGHQ